MTLERNAYQALESIVGPDNISEDATILAGYSFYPFTSFDLPGRTPGKKWTHSPDAVILPGTTEEVQAIIKTCNRLGIHFKALSTGWAPFGAVLKDNSVIMDMRRMNRIIEINEKNMYAVVEPYVTAMQLRAEVMKRGLMCHVIGAGPNHSVLASCSGWEGIGATAFTTSHNNRNILGAEWVVPTGEVVRWGAPGSNAGWFCGDGPGPGLRGVFRGKAGPSGGLGVCTKIATKLYPWPGPPELEVTGETPSCGYEIPENIKLYIAEFPDWVSMNDAAYKIGDAKIGYFVWRTASPESVAIILAPQLGIKIEDIYDLIEQIFPRHRLEITIAAYSAGELEYEESVLKDIVEEVNGTLRIVEEDPFLGSFKEILFSSLVFQNNNAAIFSLTGDFATTFGSLVSPDRAVRAIPLGMQIRKKYIDAGNFVQDGPENFWGGPEEENRHTHYEGLIGYDPADPESLKGVQRHAEEEMELVIKEKLGEPIGRYGGEAAEILGPLMCNYHLWVKRIKKTLDPKNLSDGGGFYVEPE
ncbi:MAG: FAD-binding oxidoreductase [Candidatus Lokiarchaeia archaeon]